MTVASYLAAPGNGGIGEIRRCLAHGYISLDDPHTEGVMTLALIVRPQPAR